MLHTKTKVAKPALNKRVIHHTTNRSVQQRRPNDKGYTSTTNAINKKLQGLKDLEIDTSTAAQPAMSRRMGGGQSSTKPQQHSSTTMEKKRYQQLQNQQVGKIQAMDGVPKQKLTISDAVKPAQEIHKKTDLSGVPLTDFDTMFKNSKLSNLFSHEQTHNSFFSRMEDGDTVYLMGSRRLVDPHGRAADTNFCLLQRTLDKQNRRLLDRLVALDYESGLPFEQYLITQLEEDLMRAAAMDKDQESGEVISRTFIRLRGEPWKWHSAVAMSKIEPKVNLNVVSQEYLDSLPQTYAISRLKFGENGLISEKLVRQNDNIVLTVVDELKVTTQKIFESKIEKIFKEYSDMLTNEIETAAQQLGSDEEANEELLDQFRGGMTQQH